MENRNFQHLDIAEVEGITPLGLQFGVHPRLSVPVSLRPCLIDDPAPSGAEIARYGEIAAVPPMRTYLVADAHAFPDWQSVQQSLTFPHRCLFTGEAGENLGHLAPHLIELAEGDEFTRRLFTFLEGVNEKASLHHWHRPFGLILRSREGAEALFRHLRHFTKLQDEAGVWHFRRFWDARHSYYWLPLLQNSLQVAARFFGRTRSQATAIIHSIAIPDGARGRMLVSRWNDDMFLSEAQAGQLPVSRQQPLDGGYRMLLNSASQARSLDKVARYLTRAYPQRFGKPHLAGPDLEAYVRDCREVALRLGATTELGWTRVATIAAHLGIGFLDDARFSQRGLSYARIGYDSQGEKVFAIGRECARPVIAFRARMKDEAFRQRLLRVQAELPSTGAALLHLLDQIDPDARDAWGETALSDWASQFLAIAGPFGGFGRSLVAQLALAYGYGHGFRADRSLSYCNAIAAQSAYDCDLSQDDHDRAVFAAFESEFGKG